MPTVDNTFSYVYNTCWGDRMTFGEFMRAKGHTAKSLAEAVGVNVRTMEGYTTGRFPLKNSKAWLIVALADVLETTPKDLLTLDA